MKKLPSRNKEIRTVRVADIVPNPKNMRTHPEAQKQAFAGVVDSQAGWYGYPDVFEHPDHPGKVMLIDGELRLEYLRKTYGDDGEVQVNVTDHSTEEADAALLTHDPVSAMARTSRDQLDRLLADVSPQDKRLVALVRELKQSATRFRDTAEDVASTYTNKITPPTYTPKGDKPKVESLLDRTRTNQLLEEIDAATGVPGEVKAFLRHAAERHTVYHFALIAEFYCHANPETQRLMESSALIIIDFAKAIENGLVHLTDRLAQLAGIEEDSTDE